MFDELSITIGKQNFTAFFQGGFYTPSVYLPYLHRHNYTEVHLVTGGNAKYSARDELFCISEGQMIVIPRNTLHCCTNKDETTRICSFQINYDVKDICTFETDSGNIADFIEEIEKSVKSGYYTKVSFYIALFCAEFIEKEKLSVRKTRDDAFLIYEFMWSNYALNVRLCDLAEVLHLSERQTERLVIKYMGKPFRGVISNIRMEMAKKLMETTDMPMSEIAKSVGYKSYAGFWKAIKKA